MNESQLTRGIVVDGNRQMLGDKAEFLSKLVNELEISEDIRLVNIILCLLFNFINEYGK